MLLNHAMISVSSGTVLAGFTYGFIFLIETGKYLVTNYLGGKYFQAGGGGRP